MSGRPNLSMSIVALTSAPLKAHSVNYKELAMATPEGVFMNLVDRGTSTKLLAKFKSTMDVYPSNEHPLINEIL